jgi:N utilization substance protein A
MLFDMKLLKATLEQIEQEKKLPADVIWDAIEHSLAAAYKKELGHKGQIIRCSLDKDTGDASFSQIKIVVDETTVRPALAEGEIEPETEEVKEGEEAAPVLPRFDEEKHIMITDARRIKGDVVLGEELVFPLEQPEQDFGRIAAQTAKQVIIQKIRDAERNALMSEYSDREGEVLTGTVQKVERGMIFVEFPRAMGTIPKSEQIPGERFRTGDRIKAYLYSVEDGPRGVGLRLSRSHPRLIEAFFAMESPEVASGVVSVEGIAREAGSRSKIAVRSHDENVDPIGSCVGQKGIRIETIRSELHGEKIDIIKWSPDIAEYIANSLSPAKPIEVEVNEAEHIARVVVPDDKFSLAIGKGGENVRLAAKLTGWKIDIKSITGEEVDENGNPINKQAFDKVVAEVKNEAELNDADGNLDNNEEYEASDEVADTSSEETTEGEAVE